MQLTCRGSELAIQPSFVFILELKCGIEIILLERKSLVTPHTTGESFVTSFRELRFVCVRRAHAFVCMCVCVCTCARQCHCVRERDLPLPENCVCACMCVQVGTCACHCVCVRETFSCLKMCVCVCIHVRTSMYMCVSPCVRETERDLHLPENITTGE